MVVKVYISGISGNKEVKKRQQKIMMILDSKLIKYEVVDITEPGKEPEKDFMQVHSTSPGATVGDTNPRHPLPPQLFNDQEYCGDYDLFDLANEVDTLEQFLKVEPPTQPDLAENQQKEVETVNSIADAVDGLVEQIASNGIASSREPSVEAGDAPAPEVASDEAKLNGDAPPAVETAGSEVKEDDVKTSQAEVLDTANINKDLSPSEDLIASEQATAE